MTLWVVGQNLTIEKTDRWEFVGVFENEELAVAACETFMFFVGPVTLNASFGSETVPWPGAYFPIPYAPATAAIPSTEESK